MSTSPSAVPPRVQLPSKPRDTFRIALTTTFVVIFGWAAFTVELKWSRLLGAPGDMYRLFKVMYDDLPWEDLGRMLGLMWDSIAMAWIGTLIAALFAVPLAFLAAENLVGRPVAWVTRQVFNILRAVPEIILALLFIPIFGLSPMAGVLAIGIHSIGSLGKLLYEIIENVQSGPIEATDAVGASGVQRLRWGVIPQVAPELTSFVLYRFEINIRASSVLGIVGAGGIGGALADAIRFKEYDQAGLLLLVVIAGTIAVDTISGAVRRRIVAGRPVDIGDISDAPPAMAMAQADMSPSAELR
jgi:phosphonate transport system permease protein